MLPTAHVITVEKVGEVRLKQVENILKSIEQPYQVHIMKPSKDKVKGCFESHMCLYRYAQEHELEYIFIMEDNIMLSPNVIDIHETMSNITDFMQHHAFNVIYVGAFLIPALLRAPQPITKGICETFGTHGTSAYIIHRNFYTKLLQRYPSYQPGCASDAIIEQYNHRYICNRLLFYRDCNTKSIVNSQSDNIRKLMHNVHMYGLSEQLYFHRIYTVAHIILTLILLVTTVIVVKNSIKK